MVKVKICGISNPEHAIAVAEAGADFIGMVFAPSKRKVDSERAFEIIAEINKWKTLHKNNQVKTVAVFVNESVEVMNQTVKTCQFDYVQLNGEEAIEQCQEVSVPVFKALRLDDLNINVQAERYSQCSSYILLDSAPKGIWGGTGKTGSWDVASVVSKQYPLILAGGLTPENVAEAVRKVQPEAVDVSTGVETDGIKDPEKIYRFICNAKQVSI